MKKLGIIFIFCMMQNVFAMQPILSEHRKTEGFCHKFFQYVKQKPVFTASKAQTKQAFTYQNQANIRPAPQMTGPVRRNLPSCINAIYTRGAVDLELIGGNSSSRLCLNSPYPGLDVKICNNGLYIDNTKQVQCNLYPRPKLKIYLNQLRELAVSGDSNITISHLSTYCDLSITDCGTGCICICGPVALSRVVNSGCATICARSVCANHIHILTSNYGTVKLAGSANVLLIRAFQHSEVNTRFMCSNEAMVQTAEEALVTVKTRGSLHAFAGGLSNIYYYTTPNVLVQDNVLSGNVFQMGGP